MPEFHCFPMEECSQCCFLICANMSQWLSARFTPARSCKQRERRHHITCPDQPDGTPLEFTVPKSILMRSPTLKKFFKSEHYLPGCDMHLIFTLDPGACVKIALLYLEKGVDVFNQECINVGANAYSNPIDQFHILIRLYLLATSLRLPRLADMTYQGLLDRDKPMQAAYMTTLAG